MRKRVSDYIADFLAENQIQTIFTVVGGGAMYLNDSFGHHEKLTCFYNHHEQASAMAAEGYARSSGRMAAVCVTSGPGAINALNGVAGAYQDSVPMLVFSGQTKLELTTEHSGLKLRALGNQEFPIVSALSSMTKYAEMICDPLQIRRCLEQAFYLAGSGRQGPAWLDIPLDIQGAYIETDNLEGYQKKEEIKTVSESVLHETVLRMEKAERPVIYAGNGIRLSGGKDLLHALAEKSAIPVVTCWDSIDLIETEHPLYAGRAGTMGDRAGNFAVQNSDFLLCIGTRLNIYQVGYDVKSWARGAFSIVVDIDPEELKKPTIRADLPVCADASQFMRMLLEKLQPDAGGRNPAWTEQCRKWKKRYPAVLERHRHSEGSTNVYAFMDRLSRMAGDGTVTVVSNGSASVVGSQAYCIGKDQRFILNCAMSSMGYELPAAIGASIGIGRKEVICIAGDGSMQMNLQELQTIVTNALPVKIFVINNGGYHQIRLTQNNMFQNGLAGVGPESGDLGFPETERLAAAYRMPYFCIRTNGELESVIQKVLSCKTYCLCEVICSHDQVFEPKLAAVRRPDGSLYSPPLEDMSPFLPRKELEENMYIPLMDESYRILQTEDKR